MIKLICPLLPYSSLSPRAVRLPSFDVSWHSSLPIVQHRNDLSNSLLIIAGVFLFLDYSKYVDSFTATVRDYSSVTRYPCDVPPLLPI